MFLPLAFVLLIAYFMAKLEINIEGKHGWAENLPTWRKKSKMSSPKKYNCFTIMVMVMAHTSCVQLLYNELPILSIPIFTLLPGSEPPSSPGFCSANGQFPGGQTYTLAWTGE